MSNGWSLYIIALVLSNVLGALWLLWWTAKRRDTVSSPTLPSDATIPGADGATTGHVWDGDLTEYNHPLPRWWLWLFYATVIFAVIYLILYPGFGRFPGILHWSQQRQHQEQTAVAERAYAQRFARFAALDLRALSHNPEALSMARNLFANNCSACHGSDARGAAGFPNLTDADWLYGGDPDTIYQTIANGRNGVMPAWGPVLGAQGVEEVLAYVLKLSGQSSRPDLAAAGQTKFEQICAACHGMDGRGNKMLGAPNLTDNIWLYGGSPQSIRASIVNGHDIRMPEQLGNLGSEKVRLLAAYVLSLSETAARKSTDARSR